MNIAETRKLSIDELKQQLLGLMKQQFGLRMQKGNDDTVKPHESKQLRRNIARLKTLLNEKSKEKEGAA